MDAVTCFVTGFNLAAGVAIAGVALSVLLRLLEGY